MNKRLINKLLDDIEQAQAAQAHQIAAYMMLAKAGDALAHCGMRKDYPEIWDAWWKARGGHERCTACGTQQQSSEPK